MLVFYLLLSFAPQWLEELAKFPALMTHFQTHLQEDPNLSLGKFLKQHYGEDYAEHHNQHDHSNLPGKAKHNDSCIHMHVAGIAVPLQPTEVIASPIWKKPKNSVVFAPNNHLRSTYLSCIWQPPRV